MKIKKVTWPDNAPFAVALSHDVDRVTKGWQFVYHLALAGLHLQPKKFGQQFRSLKLKIQGADPYWNFEKITGIEDDLGVRSTFFFLNERGRVKWLSPKSIVLFWGRYDIASEPIKKIIRNLDANGWEIGLHGSYNSYRSKPLLKQEKEELELILGKPIVGGRQHYLNLDIPETWRLHKEIGLRYDSTLGYSTKIGFRWDMVHPFYPKDPVSGCEIPLLQIPIGIMDAPLMNSTTGWKSACSLIEFVQEKKGILTLDWHQRVFNPWDHAGWQEMYIQLIQKCQRRGAWVAPLRDIANWWINVCE